MLSRFFLLAALRSGEAFSGGAVHGGFHCITLRCAKVRYPLRFTPQEKFIMLYTIVVILLVLWLLGFIAHIGGGLIHLILVIALIVLIFNFISGRR